MFKKYESLENSYNTKTMMDFANAVGNEIIQWVIMEKIHGANFQICYDEQGFHAGKRSNYLNDGENFYNWEKLITDRMKDKLKEIYEDEGKPVRMFGELFGGKYEAEHSFADEVRVSCPKCVQREVQYSPFNHILFYDIQLGDEFLCWDEVQIMIHKYGLGKNCGIQFEQPIAVLSGKLDEIIKFKNDFQSQISQVDLSYEKLPVIEGNICEGIVIKPLSKEYRTYSGQRVIIKSKNDKFSEKKKEKKPIDDTTSALTLESFNKMRDYINENRANAVFSKDSWTNKDFGKFIKNFLNDVYEDAQKDGIELPQDEKISNLLRGRVQKEIVSKFKNYFFGRI